jgi:hypothetical protein
MEKQKFRILFYHDGEIIYLAEEYIIDINLVESKLLNGDLNKIIVDYKDDWTNYYLEQKQFDSFFVMIKVYDEAGNFLQQLEFLTEKHEVSKTQMILHFEQSITNKAWTSINPSWVDGIHKYNEKRLVWNRIKNIERFIL